MSDTDDTRPARALRPKAPPTTAQWWRADERGIEPHKVIDGVLRTIRSQQSTRYEAMRHWAEIYGFDLRSMGHESNVDAYSDRLATNKLASTIDTLHSQIFKNRIVPSPQTTGGDWQQQQRAKQLGRWLDGVYDEADFFDRVVSVAGLDSLVSGTGIMRVWSEEDEDGDWGIRIGRCDPLSCYTDLSESRAGCPRSFYYTEPVDRYVLLDKFGVSNDSWYGSRSTRAEAIERATPTAEDQTLYSWDTTGDQLQVTYGWHLPSGPRSDDGKFFVGIQGATLAYLPWTRSRFPFAFIRYGVPLAGFWGMSAVARIAPAQRELDKMNARIQAAIELMGVPRIVVTRNSKIALQHIDDVIGSVLVSDDINGIREWDAMPLHPQIFQHRDYVSNEMGGLLGVSGFSSQSELPAGLKQASGVAIERFEDVEQARQAMLHRSYEHAVLMVAECCIDEATELAEDGIDVQVRARSKTTFEPVKWSEVQLDRKQFVLSLPPASALPKTPAAKQQRLVELLDRQAISLKTFQRQAGIIDVDSVNELDAADEDEILRKLTTIVEKGEYLQPISQDDLKLAIKLAGKYYNWCCSHNVPADRLAMVSQFIDEAIALDQRGAPPPAPPGPPGMPPGPPMGPDPMMPPGGEPMPPPEGAPMPPDAAMPPGGMAA